MTPKQAAEVIGCHPNHVRNLIAAGKLKARRVPNTPENPFNGFVWDVDYASVIKYRDTPQGRGFPRGRKRSTT